MKSLTVDDTVRGVRLQDYLERIWPDADRAALRRLVARGSVTVNRMPARAGQRLGPGDLVELALADGIEPQRRRRDERRTRLDVLAEDVTCLAIDKPAGMPTVPDRAGTRPGVWGVLRELRPEEDLRVAHRLDRDTSGCLLLAKGLDGARRLDAAFRAGAVRKEYLALVEGRLARSRCEIDRWLGPDPQRPGRVVVAAAGQKRARAAHTAVEVVERFRGYTLLAVWPTTGRGHQVRVHLASIGHPIVGDVTYGARQLHLSHMKRGYKLRPGVVEPPLLRRMFLHSSCIEVPAPDGGEPLRARSPLPAELAMVLRKLRRFAAAEPERPCD